jgi:hypothetical protein
MEVEEHDEIGSPRNNSQFWMTDEVWHGQALSVLQSAYFVRCAESEREARLRVDRVVTVELLPRGRGESVDKDGAPDGQKTQ